MSQAPSPMRQALAQKAVSPRQGFGAWWAWAAVVVGVVATLGASTYLVQASQAYGQASRMVPARGSSKFPAPAQVPPQRP